MTPFTKKLDRLHRGDTDTAGGKASALGELLRTGENVPPGFVILSDAFETFLEENNLTASVDAIIQKIEPTTAESIASAAREIHSLIAHAEIPPALAQEILEQFQSLKAPYVAVRSSASGEDGTVTSWAGQLDTFLNTTEAKLLTNVKKCWASLYSERAIHYQGRGATNDQKHMGVIVQTMIQSEISGVAFSVHPVTEDPRHMIIECAYGLGDSLVSGRVTPDRYVMEKATLKVAEKVLLGLKPILSDVQIRSVAKVVVSIEQNCGFPCDIEWALAKGVIYILQVRPITTLSSR